MLLLKITQKLVLGILILFFSLISFVNAYPTILNATASPNKVSVGQNLTISADVRDISGISKVTSIMPFDYGADVINLSLSHGTEFHGLWKGVWQVHDTIQKHYVSIVNAINLLGFSSSKQVRWYDPVAFIETYIFNTSSNKAYAKNGLASSPNDYTVEAGSGDYTNLETSDDNSWKTDYATSNGEYNTQIFSYTIGERIADINNLSFEWEGHGENVSGAYTNISFWDFNTSSWFQVASYDFTNNTDKTIVATVSSDISHYVNSSSNKVVIRVTTEKVMHSSGTSCSSDYECQSGYCVDGYCCNSACSGTCMACDVSGSEGTCSNIPVGTDPDNECDTTGCGTGNCDGSGSCGYYTSGERNCATCYTCNGATSTSCVAISDNTQDTEGSNLCNDTCKKCSSGSCINESYGEDLFSQCSEAYTCSGYTTRLRNMCDGSGACDDIDSAANYCSGNCSSYCSNGNCISNDTSWGTCNGTDNTIVASGGDGFCLSGTCWTCGDNVTFTYRGSSVTYGTVSDNSECWLDRNLGASRVATAYDDSSAYGDTFQWGRLDDGHQSRSSGTTTTLSSSNNPGHNKFIKSSASPYDWRSPQNNNLWQGVNGINNPCPSGWRIPTKTEWTTERDSWSPINITGAYASPLKITIGGLRYLDGTPDITYEGCYWSSTIHSTDSYYMYANSVNVGLLDGYRSYGLSVRCIKD